MFTWKSWLLWSQCKCALVFLFPSTLIQQFWGSKNKKLKADMDLCPRILIFSKASLSCEMFSNILPPVPPTPEEIFGLIAHLTGKQRKWLWSAVQKDTELYIQHPCGEGQDNSCWSQNVSRIIRHPIYEQNSIQHQDLEAKPCFFSCLVWISRWARTIRV